jgi:hypothetical protein
MRSPSPTVAAHHAGAAHHSSMVASTAHALHQLMLARPRDVLLDALSHGAALCVVHACV